MIGLPIMKRIASLALSATMAASLAMASTVARAEEAPIKIGLTTDLTGIAAAYATAQVNSVKMAIEEINAAGGIKGRKLELLVRDSQLKPALGASLTRDLIVRDKVDYFIGPDASSVGVAVSGVAKQYKKVVVMTIPNTPRLTGELFHKYFFTIVPSGTMLARAMAEGAVKASRAAAAVAITGVAGPGGGSAEKPVGLVWFAVARRDGPTTAQEMRYGDLGRDQVRTASVFTALELLFAALE